MKTEVIPLGTSSATPTRERHLSSTALLRAGRILLFDCGEGTQFRLIDAGLSISRVDAIFITHLHGDHFFGLPGLLTSMSLNRRHDPMTIVGPRGLATILQAIPGVGEPDLSFPVDFVEFEEDFGKMRVMETLEFVVEARPIEHRIPAAGFRFEERPQPGNLDADRARALGVTDFRDFRRLKSGQDVSLPDGRVVQADDVVGPPKPGISFAYIFDSRPCEAAAILGRNADLMFHDATFTSAHAERAVTTGHSTAAEAARVATQAGAHKLLLGHFSARYRDTSPLVEEARRLFKNTHAAEELKRYDLTEAQHNAS